MATKATVNKLKEIARLVDVHRAKREELKAAGDYAGLARLPRNSSTTRRRLCCNLTGRTRGVYRKFRLCRNEFRRLALEGKIPGVTKSSW